jgi:RHS repeat-associated protein
MKKLFLCFIYPLFLFATWDELFLDQGDPALYENVNVITGKLQLSFEDAEMIGPVTIPIRRTYCSAGAEERDKKDTDLKLHELRKFWGLSGGWSVMPHMQMLVDPRVGERGFQMDIVVYLPEPSGQIIPYIYDSGVGDSITLKPVISKGQTCGLLSGRTNPKNNRIQIEFKQGKAVVHLANGGYRVYKGDYFSIRDNVKTFGLPLVERGLRYYLLEEEKLPSNHFLAYRYDLEKGTATVTLIDPTKTRRYSSITIQAPHSKANLYIDNNLKTSYRTMTFRKRDYLEEVLRPGRGNQKITYTQTQKGKGASLETISFAGREELRVAYQNDKVAVIKKPSGTAAVFSYTPRATYVETPNKSLTVYYHDEGKLTEIRYYDVDRTALCSQKFFLENGYLIAKALLDANGYAIFSKTFVYDDFGNVVQERLYGNLTGGSPGPYSINTRGELHGAESYTKTYRYDPKTNLLQEECEESGIIYTYSYKKGTDLLTSKVTSHHGQKLFEEVSLYDDHNLLIEETITDGNFSKTIFYENDAATGLPVQVTKDGITTRYIYGAAKEVLEEIVYDRENKERYTLYSAYDTAGRLIKKTAPLGGESFYGYDQFDDLVRVKENNRPTQELSYNTMHQISRIREGDKSIYFLYDLNGRCIREESHLGVYTETKYDVFGRKIKTTSSEVQDENGISYTPEASFIYDLQGNLIEERNAARHITKAQYTTLQKPVHIVRSDGSEIHHTYTKNGLISKTSEPENTEIFYAYDPLQRMVSKEISGRRETFHYKGLLLEAHETGRGLCTNYTYDSYGAVVEEDTSGRVIRYEYDPLGRLSLKTSGDISHTTIHDEEGQLIEEHTETEDHFFYTYVEGKKVEIAKNTSDGLAVDKFSYDESGRVILHTDPMGEKTSIEYGDFSKTVIDPIGNKSVESYDLLGRKISVAKEDPSGQRLYFEEFFYDRAGNVAKQLTYNKDTTLELLCEYDPLSRIVQQTEGQDRKTSYRYDKKGRLLEKRQPSGVSLLYTYDAFDRLQSLKTSDGTISYQYTYESHEEPIKIEDLIQSTALVFTYNLFSEKLSENNSLFWEYDEQGRVIRFTLLDKSSISYTYQGRHMVRIERLQSDGNRLYEHKYTKFDVNGHVEEEKFIGSLGVQTTERDFLERPIKVTSPYATEILPFGPSGLLMERNHSLFPSRKYAYDPLGQLTDDGDIFYDFDSLGNAVNDKVDKYNQVVKSEGSYFQYDLNGNLLKKDDAEPIFYEYDALNRLTRKKTKEEDVFYSYDPLSRLASRENSSGKYFYLYDGESEIGLQNEAGQIVELKVLGLGIKGEIGAAVALEVKDEIFLPLHDTGGNIIAVVDLSKKIRETYLMDAFGREEKDGTISPWRFSSRRHEGDLVYFGNRFYDLILCRWLTPDPIGFKDHRNPYLFVLNSPTNRLDLFGLLSIQNFKVDFYFDAHSQRYCYPSESMSPPQPISCLMKPRSSQGVFTDAMCILYCSYPLQFTPKEQEQGFFDFGDHIHNFTAPTGSLVGLWTHQNGINTSIDDWKEQGSLLCSHIPAGMPLFSIYNPTDGGFGNLVRVGYFYMTGKHKHAANLRKIHTDIAASLEQINKQALVSHFAYSEGAIIVWSSFNALNSKERELLDKHLLVNTIGAGRFCPKDYGKESINYFSSKDFLAKILGRKYLEDDNYIMREIRCVTPRSQRPFGLDHNFAFPTQQEACRAIVRDVSKKWGLYANSR